MRTITYQTVVDAVEALCLTAAFDLPEDVVAKMHLAAHNEKTSLGKSILQQCLENADIATSKKVAICQDTGFSVYLVELGTEVLIEGGLLSKAIDQGTAQGYEKGFLRKSIVDDPLFDRKNTGTNTPAVIHIEIVPGKKLKITLAPKGGGSENMSAVAMLKPADGINGVSEFVVNSVIHSGGNPCPPTVVGVGIGGTFEKVAYLAKKALFRETGLPNADPRYAELEASLLQKINASGVGPQGLGGTQTALAVHIETYPCHIASLPVAVNLNCHAARHASIVL